MQRRNIAAFSVVMLALALGYGYKAHQEAKGVVYPTFSKEFNL